MFKENATFYCWKASGKYYTEGRGHFPEAAFAAGGPFDGGGRLALILSHNEGKWPGLSGTGSEFTRVAIPDEECECGWPLIFKPDAPIVFKGE